jgi:hypothetical protein
MKKVDLFVSIPLDICDKIADTRIMTTTQDIRGWRLITVEYGEPQVGDDLAPSYVWIGDEPTDEMLSGTCAFDTRAACEQYAKYSRGWIVELTGEDYRYGELDGEIIIESACVVSVETWRQ